MKVQRISTALSLTLLTALSVAPIAQAVGDPNIDSGVGSAASRGPYGFNHTGGQPVYDTPPNDYGVWRDAYGGLRDAGMQPDNLTVRVHEPTWEETHPQGPPVPSGAPGGLASGLGAGGLGGLGFGLGLGFPLGAGLGSLASFTGVSPISTAGAAALTNPVPLTGGTGLGPFASVPRSTFGFAGTPGGYLNAFPFTGQRYMGQASGYIVNPQVTSSNVTANGISTNTTTWNTTFGKAQLSQAISGPATNQTVVTTFFINGNRYSSTANGVQAGAAPTSVMDPTIANLLNMFGLNIPINNPAPNSTITTRLNTGNATSNPFLPRSAFFDPSAFVHQGSIGTLGGSYATPATAGDQNSFFWGNTVGSTGTLGGSFATPATEGGRYSPFYGGSFNSTTIGGGYPTNATNGSQRSVFYPNPNLGNGAGIGGGNLSSVGFGLPGYGVPNFGVGFPGYTGGGYGGGGYLGGGYGGISAGMPTSNPNESPTTGFYTTNSIAGSGAASSTTGTVTAVPSGGGAFTQNIVGAPVNGVMSSTTETTPGGTSTTNSFSETFPQDESTYGFGGAPAPQAGSSYSQGTRPAPPRGYAGPISSNLPARTRGGAYIDNGDGAYGFFGGTPAVVAALAEGSEYGLPWIGNRLPSAAYTAATDLRTFRRTESGAAGGYGPAGNITTELEPKLAAMHLTACQALGRLIGSQRFANGDIIAYGTNGTLRLAADNSGTITLNDGEILTFKSATPEVRTLALRSTLLF